MSRKLKLGSLFDGIGGFPLAGKMAGIVPVWASEIEPFPVRVTEKRLPEMKHYGDVHGLNGADLEPVDIITFGSPCQDLSIAGKRSGLGGSRSGLFYEAMRVITEMRKSTNGKYPRWAVWENVPGALSSQNGQDFRRVLESLVRIKDPAADVPLPESGRWLHAGEILGDSYSLAWRVLDAAQGWGVAQRRKRIFAVLDLDGQYAGKVLFESEGVSGYTPPGGKARKGTAPGAESSAGTAGERISAGGFCTEHSADSRGIGYEDERAPTLRAGVVPGVAIDFNPTDSRIRLKEDICQTLTARMGTGGNTVPLTMVAPFCKGTRPHSTDEAKKWKEGDVANTLNTYDCGEQRCNELVVKVYGISSDQSHAMLSENPNAGVYEADTSRTLDCSDCSPNRNQGGMMVVEPVEKPCYCIQGSMIGRKEQNGPQGDGINREVAFTLDTVDRHAVYAMTTGCFTQVDQEKSPPLMARDYKDPPVVGKDEPVYALDRACFSAGENAQYSMNVGEEKAPTLVAEGPGAVAAPAAYLVRRLTPGECCRLQGYPDGWCENLESPAPSNKETDRWEAIFEEWRTAMGGKTKPKTRRQIIRWLQNPHTDSAEYKAYGNSIVAQCAFLFSRASCGQRKKVSKMRTINLNGYIDEEVWYGDEITPVMLHDALYGENGEFSDDVRIILNSYGGSCNAAVRMHDDIRAYPGRVHLVISGTAASAATVLSAAADTLEMTPGSLYMIHDPSTVAWGNERDFSEAIALLKACKESILNIYSRRSPIDRGTLAAMMTATTWMDAGAALAQGFIDSVADPQTCPTDSAAVRTVNRKDAEAKVRLWLERCHARKQENAAALPAAAQCENPGVPADQLRRRLDLIKPNDR